MAFLGISTGSFLLLSHSVTCCNVVSCRGYASLCRCTVTWWCGRQCGNIASLLCNIVKSVLHVPLLYWVLVRAWNLELQPGLYSWTSCLRRVTGTRLKMCPNCPTLKNTRHYGFPSGTTELIQWHYRRWRYMRDGWSETSLSALLLHGAVPDLTFWHRSFTFHSNKSPAWCKKFFSLLSWRLSTAQHVSGVFPPIIRSSMTAVAASGFTFVSWW